jgi:hypothetical protein
MTAAPAQQGLPARPGGLLGLARGLAGVLAGAAAAGRARPRRGLPGRACRRPEGGAETEEQQDRAALRHAPSTLRANLGRARPEARADYSRVLRAKACRGRPEGRRGARADILRARMTRFCPSVPRRLCAASSSHGRMPARSAARRRLEVGRVTATAGSAAKDGHEGPRRRSSLQLPVVAGRSRRGRVGQRLRGAALTCRRARWSRASTARTSRWRTSAPIWRGRRSRRCAPTARRSRQTREQYDPRQLAAAAAAHGRGRGRGQGQSRAPSCRPRSRPRCRPPTTRRSPRSTRPTSRRRRRRSSSVRDQVIQAMKGEGGEKVLTKLLDELRAKAKVERLLPDVSPPALDLQQPAARGLRRARRTRSVRVVEFSDFECPYCSRAAETLQRAQGPSTPASRCSSCSATSR